MKVREAIKILEKYNQDLPIFISLNIDSTYYLKHPGLNNNPLVSLDGLVNYQSYLGIIPSIPLEIKCPK